MTVFSPIDGFYGFIWYLCTAKWMITFHFIGRQKDEVREINDYESYRMSHIVLMTMSHIV